MCIENIFYKTKKLQMKILLGKSHIALRKCKGNNKNITAGQIKQQGTLDRLIRHDDGYKFLNALKGNSGVKMNFFQRNGQLVRVPF